MSQNNKNNREKSNRKLKIIRSVDELPSWYNLKKYNGAKNFDETEWHEQLEIRRAFYDFFIGEQKDYWNPNRGYGKAIMAALDLQRQSPLRKLSERETIFIGGGWLYHIKYKAVISANRCA